jgi:DNA polymerase III subunit delta'
MSGQLWRTIQTMLHHQNMPQAILITGSLHAGIDALTLKITQQMMCSQKNDEPCGVCSDCFMSQRQEHPDVNWVRPLQVGSVIKIEQIRALQSKVFLSPQRAAHQIIVIESADRMNTAAANALLKVLEEPPKHVIFILCTEHVSTILPTVLSRCQVYHCNSPEINQLSHLLSLGEHYPSDAARALVIHQASVILDGLIALLQGSTHACMLASQWTKYELCALLWFLYWVYDHIQISLFGINITGGSEDARLHQLIALLNPQIVFKQIVSINTLLKKISHNMNVNHLLALEDLLLGLR